MVLAMTRELVGLVVCLCPWVTVMRRQMCRINACLGKLINFRKCPVSAISQLSPRSNVSGVFVIRVDRVVKLGRVDEVQRR